MSQVPPIPDPSGPPARDRRRGPRQPHIIEAWLYPDASNDPQERIEIVSLNLSKHGIGFHIDRPAHLGSIHAIEIGFGPQRLLSQVKVVSCAPVEGGLYNVGAEFC